MCSLCSFLLGSLSQHVRCPSPLRRPCGKAEQEALLETQMPRELRPHGLSPFEPLQPRSTAYKAGTSAVVPASVSIRPSGMRSRLHPVHSQLASRTDYQCLSYGFTAVCTAATPSRDNRAAMRKSGDLLLSLSYNPRVWRPAKVMI